MPRDRPSATGLIIDMSDTDAKTAVTIEWQPARKPALYLAEITAANITEVAELIGAQVEADGRLAHVGFLVRGGLDGPIRLVSRAGVGGFVLNFGRDAENQYGLVGAQHNWQATA